MDKRLIAFAREHRKNPTWAETTLWSDLRAGQFGHKFRRQQPIGPYIVDFVCFEKRLIIEVDGLSHDIDDSQRDRIRQRWLEDHGYVVLRFNDDEVHDERDEVGDAIAAVLDQESPT